MTTPNELALVSDPWSPFSHKRAMRELADGRTNRFAPWYYLDQRRLTAYRIAQDYIDNQARGHLDTTDGNVIADHREYGDAALIVNQALAGLLGEEQDIVVDGAADYDPNLEDPAADGSNTTPEQWAENEQARLALDRQEWLRQWATDSRLWLKLHSNERKAIGLGDCVYVLGWDGSKGRVGIKTYDPGFYFPDLDEAERNDEDFPSRIHIAFETDPDPSSGAPRKLRRITWELAPIPPASRTVIDEEGRAVRETVFSDNEAMTPILVEGDRVSRDTFRIERQYPWLPDGEWSGVTCVMTDAEWLLEDVKLISIYDLSYDKAVFRRNGDGEVIQRLDLHVDFLPVVHVPNTIAEEEHFGRSTLGTVLQVLDDLAATDTDLSKAAATTGSPPIALGGATLAKDERRTYGPGQVFEVGDGKMDVLDTSNALDALLKLLDALFSRLSTNSRLPESVLGRVKPSDVPSGIALALSFGPLQSMVREMRQVRDEKYPLLLRFVQRFSMVGLDGKKQPVLTEGEVYTGRIAFGSYLPADKSGAAELVARLLVAKAISTQTGVTMLVEAGFPIDDAAAEVERIEHENYDAALTLWQALGSTDAVKELLGLQHVPDAQVTPPGNGGGNGGPPTPDLSGGQPGQQGIPTG